MLVDVLFAGFALLTVGSAVLVVTLRNIVRAAFALLFTFFGVAGLYVFLGADFLAATQVLLYVGGILVLLLFAVMLTQKIGAITLTTQSRAVLAGLVVVGALAVFLVIVATTTPWALVPLSEPRPTTATVGRLLLTDFLLPFEIVSVLLLAALVGAVLMARREGAGPREAAEGE